MGKFEQMLEAFNKRNHFEIDAEPIISGVKAAMRYDGKMRDDWITKILTDTFPSLSSRYEKQRCERNTHSRHNFEDERYKNTCNESQFLTGYIDIIAECAKEADPNYRPEFMLGLKKTKIKEMLENMFATYTYKEELRNNMVNYENIRESISDIDRVKRKSGEANDLRNYEQEPKEAQKDIRDLYMRKEVLKAEMKQRNIFWRLFSSDAWAMRKYINAAEQALKDVHFTREGERKAKAELDGPAAREEYRKQTAESIDTHFERLQDRCEEIRNKQHLLTVRFHPDRATLAAHLKAAEELGELLKADNGNISQDVKEIFEFNCEKLRILKDAKDRQGKNAIYNYSQGAEGSFVSMEIAFEKSHPNLNNVSFEDVERECKKEKVSVDDNGSDSKDNIEPKKEDPALIKESVVQSV